MAHSAQMLSPIHLQTPSPPMKPQRPHASPTLFNVSSWMRAAALFIALGLVALSAARAQTVVFNDTFGVGSPINSNPTSPAAPLISQTAY